MAYSLQKTRGAIYRRPTLPDTAKFGQGYWVGGIIATFNCLFTAFYSKPDSGGDDPLLSLTLMLNTVGAFFLLAYLCGIWPYRDRDKTTGGMIGLLLVVVSAYPLLFLLAKTP